MVTIKNFLFDDSPERAKAVRICEMKLSEAFDEYCSCQGELHKAAVRAQSEKAYTEAVHRWQDLGDLRYDAEIKWEDLNFSDYHDEIEVVYGK